MTEDGDTLDDFVFTTNNDRVGPERPRHPGHHRKPALLRGPVQRQRQQREPQIPNPGRVDPGHIRCTLDCHEQELPLRFLYPGHPLGLQPHPELPDGGVLCYVSNGGYIDGNTADGIP
jgi:hypothetical protein